MAVHGPGYGLHLPTVSPALIFERPGISKNVLTIMTTNQHALVSIFIEYHTAVVSCGRGLFRVDGPLAIILKIESPIHSVLTVPSAKKDKGFLIGIVGQGSIE